MKKFLFSSLMLAFGLTTISDVDAARTMRRSGTTTSSSRGSSSSNQDISSFTRRFSEEGEKHSTILFYGKKYALSEFLYYGVSSYYKTNGSEGLNEKLCFGPFMVLTGVSNTGDIVTYTASEDISCQTLLANYTYSLELKEATAETLKNLPERMLSVKKQDVNISLMPLDYESYVDVEDFVVKIGTAIKEAKDSCSAFYNNMKDVKEKLGITTGVAVGGTALSATATGLGVQNVKKTDQIASNKLRLNELKEYDGESESIDKLYKNVESSKAVMESNAAALSALNMDEIQSDYEKIKDLEKCDSDECQKIAEKYDAKEIANGDFEKFKENINLGSLKNRQIEVYKSASDEYNNDLSEYNNAVEKAGLQDYNETTQTTQEMVDWAQMGTNTASAIASGVSFGFGIGAMNSLKSAISNLEKCQKSISNLNTLYNQYNVEANYGD